MNNTSAPRPRPRRSVKLTAQEFKAFKKKVNEAPTRYDAAIYFGFSRMTLCRLLKDGSGKEATVEGIRAKLNSAA